MDANLTFALGETWAIPFAMTTASGGELDLVGATVSFRLSRRGVLALSLTTPGADINVESPSHGIGSITVTPEDQADIYAAVWDYEVRATLADETVTTQARGAITVQRTLFE